MVMLSKFGIAASFNMLFLASDLFPVRFRNMTLGTANSFGRLTAVLSPLMVELKDPIPLISFNGVAVLGCVISFFFREPRPTKEAIQPDPENTEKEQEY